MSRLPALSPTITEPEEESSKEDDLENYGKGQRTRRPKGAYKKMHNVGLVAVVTHFKDFDVKNDPPCFQNEYALVATHPSDPKSLDEGLRGPDAKK